jgi:trimethylamine--corrinoid protein Co-methyltransferase
MKRNIHAGKLASGGLSLNILTDAELNEIHLATLEILDRTGLFFESEDALDVFDTCGAIVDRKNKIVKIPPHVVEDAIRSAPSTLVLAGRNPENDIVLSDGRVGFINFGKSIFVVDPYSKEIRKTTKADVCKVAKLVDYLSDIDAYLNAVTSHDVPQKHDVAQLHNAEAAFLNTTKNIFIGGGNSFIAKKLVEMAAAIVGGTDKLRQRPIMTFVTAPVSPLKLIRECCEILMEAARFGIPMTVLPTGMAGGSQPITLAGALVTHNAEVLGSIVLNQLTCKGAPVIYGSSTTAMDMKLASATVGSPECAVLNAAVARLARYYSLPSLVAGG